MDLESKVMVFPFEPEKSICFSEYMLQSEICFSEKIATLALGEVQKLLHNENRKECLCYQVEAVCNFNLQGIFVLSQTIISSELTHNLISISICFCNQTRLEPLPCS